MYKLILSPNVIFWSLESPKKKSRSQVHKGRSFPEHGLLSTNAVSNERISLLKNGPKVNFLRNYSTD